MALDEASEEGPATEQCTLRDDDEHGRLELEIVMPLVVLDSTWTMWYTFTLVPIAMAQVDLVESRLFDVEESLGRLDVGLAKVNEKLELSPSAELLFAKLESRILELESRLASTSSMVTEFESTGGVVGGAYAVWKGVTSDAFVTEGAGIRCLSTATYLIAVQAIAKKEGKSLVSLHNNGEDMCQIPISHPVNGRQKQSIVCSSWVLHLAKGNSLSLYVYDGSVAVTTKVVITRLSDVSGTGSIGRHR